MADTTFTKFPSTNGSYVSVRTADVEGVWEWTRDAGACTLYMRSKKALHVSVSLDEAVHRLTRQADPA